MMPFRVIPSYWQLNVGAEDNSLDALDQYIAWLKCELKTAQEHYAARVNHEVNTGGKKPPTPKEK